MLKKCFLVLSLIGSVNFSCLAMQREDPPTAIDNTPENDQVIADDNTPTKPQEQSTDATDATDVDNTPKTSLCPNNNSITETRPTDDQSALNVAQDVDFIVENTTDPYSLMTAIKQLSEKYELTLSSKILKMALKKVDISLIRFKNPNNTTVLHFAVKFQEENVVEIILGALDDHDLEQLLSSKDYMNRTPYDLANVTIKQLLEKSVPLIKLEIEQSYLAQSRLEKQDSSVYSLCNLF